MNQLSIVMSKLYCPTCNTNEISQDLSKGMATCLSCNTSFDIKVTIQDQLTNSHKVETSTRGVTVVTDPTKLEMIVQWRQVTNWKFYFVFGLSMLLFIGALVYFTFPSIMTLFLAIFLVAGLYLIYMAYYQFFNKTVVSIKNNTLSVNHRIPTSKLRNIKNINTSDVNQIFIRRKDGGSSGSKKYYNNEVHLKKNDGSTRLLVSYILDNKVANFIESKLELFLEIQDKIISEEFHPDKLESSDMKSIKVKEMMIKNAEFLAEMRNEPISKAFDVACPKCRNKVSKESYNEEKDLVYCDQCQEYFSFEASRSIVLDLSHKNIKIVPEEITVDKHSPKLSLEMRTKRKRSYLIIVVGLLFLSVFMFFIKKNEISMYFGIVPIIILNIGFTLYFFKTKIWISSRNLWVSTFPSFWYQSKANSYPINTIKQLYVERQIIENENSTSTVYHLVLQKNDGNKSRLISHYHVASTMFYLERKIEKALQISDEVMPNEFVPNRMTTPENFTEAINLLVSHVKGKKKK